MAAPIEQPAIDLALMLPSEALSSESPTLDQLAIRYGSDKGTVGKSAHRYTIVYQQIFAEIRHLPLNLLEIGLAIGGPELGFSADRATPAPPSIRMCRDYFPNATIYGFDISDFSAYAGDRFVFVRGDCGKRNDLEKLARLGVSFDIVIDDASHASFHQLLTLSTLFSSVRPGGFYIIEDLNWQPRAYETSLPRTPKTARLLRDAQRGSFFLDPALGIDLRFLDSEATTITLMTRRELRAAPNNLRAWLRLWWRDVYRKKDNVDKLAILHKRARIGSS